MLGADGPRSYLLAFQNPAESRGTGGLVGGYGVLTADHGKLSVETLGTDSDLTGLKTVPSELGPDYAALWGQDPALWVNSNESPHFPYGAQIWLDAWQAQHGQAPRRGARPRPGGAVLPADRDRPGDAARR